MDKFNLKEYLAKNPLLNEGPVEDFEDAEFDTHSASLDQEEEIGLKRIDVIAAIDELNQYLNGNVPKESLIVTLIDLVGELKR